MRFIDIYDGVLLFIALRAGLFFGGEAKYDHGWFVIVIVSASHPKSPSNSGTVLA